jgi:hypothetical protein
MKNVLVNKKAGIIVHALFIGALTAIAAQPTTAHAQASSIAANAPVYCDGDSWRILQTEFLKTGAITVKTMQAVRGSNTRFEHTLEGETAKVGARIEMRNPAGNRVQLGDVKYTPDTHAYQFPLAVGKSWAVDYSYLDDTATANATGGYKAPAIATRRQGTATVLALEKVTTPAGTFDAYRIEQKGTITQPSTQGGASPTFDSQYYETNWYAPAAKASVKYEYRHTSPRRVPTVRSSELANATVTRCE